LARARIVADCFGRFALKLHLRCEGQKIEADVRRKDDTITVLKGDVTAEYRLSSNGAPFYLLSRNGTQSPAFTVRAKDEIFLHLNGRSFRLQEISDEAAAGGDSHQAELRAISPMPGTVIKVLVEPGAAVSKGMPLVIVEAMKMENEVRAPGDAIVEQVLVSAGEKVGYGQELLKLIPPEGKGGEASAL